MSEKYIYSKRYVAERIDMGIKYPAITIQRKRNKNFNKDEFCETGSCAFRDEQDRIRSTGA